MTRNLQFYLVRFFLIFCGISAPFAQDPCDGISRNFYQYMGTDGTDGATVVTRIDEYGYIIGGAKIVGDLRYLFLARLDLCGDVIWQNLYENSTYTYPASVIFEDDIIYVSCYFDSPLTTALLKFDLDGNVISGSDFGSALTYPRGMIQLGDGNLITTGVCTDGIGAGGNDFYVVKTDLDGDIIWQKLYGNSGNEFAHSIYEDDDNNILIVGYRRDYVPGVHTGYVVKLDQDGILIWAKEYTNGLGKTRLVDLIQIGDSYYVSGFADYDSFGDEDCLLMKLDLDGNVDWTNYYGTPERDNIQMMYEKDGLIFSSGFAGVPGKGLDILVISFTTDGDMVDYTSFGSDNDESNAEAFQTFGVESDGFYGIAAGNTGLFGGNDIQFYRFDEIDSNCVSSGVILDQKDAGVYAEEIDLIIVNTVWSNETIIYSEYEPAEDGGILCASFEDTIVIEDPPCEIDAKFEYIINGISSEEGLLGGCVNSLVNFNDLSYHSPDELSSWFWSFGDGTSSSDENPTHIYDSPGSYTILLTVVSELGCVDSIYLDIFISEGLNFDLIFNEPTCHGFSDGSITINLVGGLGDIIYRIEDAIGLLLNEDNSNTANTLMSGWYYIHVSDESDCVGTDSIFLENPPEISADLTITNVNCYNEANGIVYVDSVYNSSGVYDNITYIWSPNPNGENGIGADSTWGLGAGEYVLTINDENGCSRVLDFVVEQPDSLYLVEFGSYPALCRLHEYQNGNGVVFGAVTGGTPDYEYIWTNLNTGETSDNSTWGGLNVGTYELKVKDQNGCELTKSILLDSINPSADFNILSEQLNNDLKGYPPVEIEIMNNSLNFANEYDPGADTTFMINLDHDNIPWQISHDYFEIFDTTYYSRGHTYLVDICLIAFNKNGCSDTACQTITIFEPYIFTPINIFSPNGDGINDFFTFNFHSVSIKEFTCVIVDRWGIMVAELNTVEDSWNGTNLNGNECSDGVYFYTYEAKTDDGIQLSGQGHLTLISN